MKREFCLFFAIINAYWATPGPPGGRGGLEPWLRRRSPAAFLAARPLGCLIRLNVLPCVKKVVGCVFFPPGCEAAAGIRTPSYDWLHIMKSLVTSVAEVNQTRVM